VIAERPIPDLAGLRTDFSGPQLELTLASILAGNTLARLWTGDALALLWDQGNNVFYLAGASRPGDAAPLAALISGPIRQEALAHGRPYFRARALSPALEPFFSGALAPFALHPVRKRFYRHHGPAPAASPEPAAVAFVPVDGALFHRRGFANLDAIHSEIGLMWPSEARFLARGFGVGAIAGDAIVCWCTAEYVSRRMCGIGIETVEAWQNRGIATAAARRFVRLAFSRGLTPHWECDVENLPSVRLAEKLGFTLLEEKAFQAGLFA